MQNKRSGFTFVELIIVLVIITILATIWFTAYESYLSVWRDTAKISLLRDIQNSFASYSLKSRIPLPDNSIGITASGATFAYQWDFTDDIAWSISFKWDPYDDLFSIYPTYILSDNRKDFQLLHYLEDSQSIQSFIPHSYSNYQELHPKVLWKALGIMMDEDTLEPIHLISSLAASWSYDVVSWTGSFRAYLTQNRYHEGSMIRIIPNSSCLRISELSRSRWDGIYTINPTWGESISAYCDMSTDWGWWTLIWRWREGWAWNESWIDINLVSRWVWKSDAFSPAYYSASTIDGIMWGKDVFSLKDGVRIMRARDNQWKEYQELLWRFTNQAEWSWLFDTSLALSETKIDGVSFWNGDTRDESNNGNDVTRVFTWEWASHGWESWFSYGSSVSNGSSWNITYLWENWNENHAIPYSEVYIRK